MDAVITKFETKFRKPKVTQVQSGDTVRVHQKVKEGGKERSQVFEGMVIRTRRANSLTANITVRRIASGVGVEKTYFLHSPTLIKVEVIKRTKVRRNFLSYMRFRTGKSTRLAEQEFDREATNVKEEPKTEEKQDKAAAEAEKPTKQEMKAEKESEKKSDKPEKAEAKDKSDKPDKKEEKAEAESGEAKDDKAAAKKAKAEEFRKAQEAKKK